MPSMLDPVSRGAECLVHTVWSSLTRGEGWRTRAEIRAELGDVGMRFHTTFDSLCGELADVLVCESSMVRLRLRALVVLKGRLRTPLADAERDERNIVSTMHWLTKRFRASPNSAHRIGSGDIAHALRLPELEARRVCQLLEDTNGMVINGFERGAPSEPPVIQAIHENVVDYEHIVDLSDAIAKLDGRSQNPPYADTRGATLSAIPSADPMSVLTAGIKAVPAVRYALGVAAIAAALAIVAAFKLGWLVAALGVPAMVVCMTALLVFARLADGRSPEMRRIGMTLAWASIALTILVVSLAVAVTFWGTPATWYQIAIATTGSSSISPGSFLHPRPHVFEKTGDHVIDAVQDSLNQLMAGPSQPSEQDIVHALAPLFERPAFWSDPTEDPSLQLYDICRTRTILQDIAPAIRTPDLARRIGKAIGLLIAMQADITRNMFPNVNISDHIRAHIGNQADFIRTLPAGPTIRNYVDRDEHLDELLRTLSPIMPRLDGTR